MKGAVFAATGVARFGREFAALAAVVQFCAARFGHEPAVPAAVVPVCVALSNLGPAVGFAFFPCLGLAAFQLVASPPASETLGLAYCPIEELALPAAKVAAGLCLVFCPSDPADLFGIADLVFFRSNSALGSTSQKQGIGYRKVKTMLS